MQHMTWPCSSEACAFDAEQTIGAGPVWHIVRIRKQASTSWHLLWSCSAEPAQLHLLADMLAHADFVPDAEKNKGVKVVK